MFLPKSTLLMGCMVAALGSGCATHIATRVNTFRAPGPLLTQADIAVVAANDEQGKSLEFQHYKTKVEQVLSKQGYTISTSASAKYQALVGYGVERLDTRGDSGVRTGVVTSTGSGRAGFGFGTNVLLLDDNNSVMYERKVSVAIAENTKDARRIYEVTGVSEGKCGVLSEVFDDILTGIFSEFPAQDGRLKTVKVKATSNCK